MELILNRSLQWFVCQLHANELPLRHLFAHVDKTTTGPRSLTGEIRKSLAGCEKLSVVSSTPIENTLCEVTNKKDLRQRFHIEWSFLTTVVVARPFFVVARVLVADDTGNDPIVRQYLKARIIDNPFEPVLNMFLVAFSKS
ncbi:hypothetical protein AVEN_95983-1 [Araneus ventricosus]|uniref:Uncharacterized protein n=1 Tax=Araneus ventricosus TaxID=182803 RepID=A0A4Y2B317_ARAVE|nr:hypothetical protein AVEN_95983-1 [Araneus ventricosus]